MTALCETSAALEARRLDHRAPFLSFPCLEPAEVGWRSAGRIKSQLQQTFLRFRQGKRLGEFTVQEIDDGLRRIARRVKCVPAGHLEVGHALFGDRPDARH